MISVLTGAIIGAAIGSVAGDGMEVVRDSEGKKRIKKIHWQRGYEENKFVPVAVALTIYCGLGVLGSAISENFNEEFIEQKNHYDKKKNYLLYKTDDIFDEIAKDTFEERKVDYLKMADIARNYNGDLSKVRIGIKDKETGEQITSINRFEAYGLASLPDERIEDLLWQEINDVKEERKADLTKTINEGDYWELDLVEYMYDSIENKVDSIAEKELFID